MKALTHDFGEKSEMFLFVFNKIGLEIMSHDHLVRKQALLDYKKRILHSNNIGILVKKWKFSLRLFLDKMGLEIVFEDLWGRKQTLLDCKNMIFHRRHIGFFFKGVNQWFWSKHGNFVFVCFCTNGPWNNVWWSLR